MLWRIKSPQFSYPFYLLSMYFTSYIYKLRYYSMYIYVTTLPIL